MSERNAWDQTIWDPVDPEHAIEDGMHGPSAVHESLQIPPMPRGDGTYYQPGGFYTYGTSYIDSRGKPMHIVADSRRTSTKEVAELQEWLEAYEQGDETLTALEAGRQQRRLQETGFAHTFKPSDVCPGGKKLADCEAGNAAFQAGQDWAANHDRDIAEEGVLSSVIAWAGTQCVSCTLACQVSVKTVNGHPQETCVSFYKPNGTMPVIDLGNLGFVDNPVALTELEDIVIGMFKKKEDL